ncbi:MAG TPA: hypothetical protein VNV66_07685, partial [Pilimelia sp.]|nr:hypothetical protein [Pilimelia sp.]
MSDTTLAGRATALPGGLRRTRVVTVFDDLQDPNDDGYGLPVRVDDQGDISTAADDLCTRHTYA